MENSSFDDSSETKLDNEGEKIEIEKTENVPVDTDFTAKRSDAIPAAYAGMPAEVLVIFIEIIFDPKIF